jgi:ABC-type multidrug transport system fused ATPase/permease subunit
VGKLSVGTGSLGQDLLSPFPGNNLKIVKDAGGVKNGSCIHFGNVSFRYPNGKEVLHIVSFDLERGRTYAFVGPMLPLDPKKLVSRPARAKRKGELET